MKPLKIALLWHFHQPYYKMNNEFLLPWVRLHGVKDYYDLPELMNEFPLLKQTINIVPSLSMQISEYAEKKTTDRIERLSLIDPADLTDSEKEEILRLFFLCNPDNMILPYRRYSELFDKSKNRQQAVQDYKNNDWLDLQMWYNLTWYSYYERQRPAIRRFFDKGKDFTHEEIQIIINEQKETLRKTSDVMRTLVQLGQLEVSCSPMYHPILPLICDTDSMLEAMPNAELPVPAFRYPQDAVAQVNDGINYVEQHLGHRPKGMWPSEGSISNAALDVMIEAGLSWAASDEGVLAASVGVDYDPTEKYFPRSYKSNSGEIAVLFRDHWLSDAIGFVYSRWNPQDAVGDFMNKLRSIKNVIIDKYGEAALDDAVVPVMLDGENCWEFYAENGIPFRKEFFRSLSESKDFTTVTISEAIGKKSCNYLKPITNIRAGSWINANFDIWLGEREDALAWSMLAKARNEIEHARSRCNDETIKKAMDEVFIAEGSDWFWWYGSQHSAENKNDFDVMFRYHITEIYKLLDLEPPEDTKKSIGSSVSQESLKQAKGGYTPILSSSKKDTFQWEGAGYFNAKSAMDAMHQVGEMLSKMYFTFDDKMIYFHFELQKDFLAEDSIEMNFILPVKLKLIIRNNNCEIQSDDTAHIGNFSFYAGESPELAIGLNTFFDSGISSGTTKRLLSLQLMTHSLGSEISYPRQGNLELEI